ncbi:hypothetical protein BD779DRAFT_1539894 [Infundibulicybe gibba]|nr:hypothetical protein BD779DRAFT_1539894 [Infundibulicybe gibba]
MQCIWSKTANRALGNILRLPPAPRTRINISSTIDTRLASTFPVEAQLKPRYFEGNSGPLTPPPSLTEPQLSRAASQAVRLSIQNGALEDAYYIVNSLRYSVLREDEDKVTKEKIAGLRVSLSGFEAAALHMGRSVSPRLASHALLHGLIRLGLAKKASRLSSVMMASGIQLRSATLEAIIHNLVPTHPSPRTQSPTPPFPSAQEVLKLRPPMVQHEGARLALQLVVLARRSRHRRTSGMFGTLICACLINGEIIVASLIFGLIVKDYQLRKSLATRLAPTNAPSDNPEPTKTMKRIQARFNHLQMENLFPPKSSMYSIVSSIERTLSTDGEGEAYNVSIHSALQALANLALLLDRRQIPFGEIAPLIRALYNCPKTKHEVWIVDPNGLQLFPRGFATARRQLPKKTSSSSLRVPSLDLSSYNSLLHYVLRHRLSPSLADKTLHHMVKERHKPLYPDTVTYNILIRSGTLLRTNGVAGEALQLLYQSQERLPNRLLKPPEAQRHIFDPEEEPLRSLSVSPGLSGLKIDAYTITSHVKYLVSTGSPRAVLAFVRDVLRVLDTGTSGQTDRASRDSQLRLVVTEGPYIFTAILDTLHKSEEWELAERIWGYAKRAERKSWDARPGSNTKPWYLPEHAYTSMLQCYFTEERDRPADQPSTILKRARAVYDSLLYIQRVPAAGPPPKPDARFFNAALELFLQTEPRLGWTCVGSTAKMCRKGLRDATVEYARTGELAVGWNPTLQTIAEDIVDAGYSVPYGLRPLFVGRWPQGTWQHNGTAKPQRRPFAFPRRQKMFSPHSIPTQKSRGLPLHRSRRSHPSHD